MVQQQGTWNDKPSLSKIQRFFSWILHINGKKWPSLFTADST